MIRAFIKGGSGAVAGGAGAATIAPDQFNPMTQTGHFFELSGFVFAISGAHELFQYLKDNPVPDDDTQFLNKPASADAQQKTP